MSKYASRAELLADLQKASLSLENDEQVKGKNDPIDSRYQASLILEYETEYGPVANLDVQRYYVMSDGTAILTQPHKPIRDYLIIKQELQDASYDGMTVDEKFSTLKNKTVRKGAGSERIHWSSVQIAIGTQRFISIKQQLESLSDPGQNAVYQRIDSLLQESGAGVDPSLDEFRSQVDAIGSLTDMTASEKDNIKAIGEEAWSRANNVTIRKWHIENISG